MTLTIQPYVAKYFVGRIHAQANSFVADWRHLFGLRLDHGRIGRDS
jgi:hypothetical protein